MQLCLPPDVEAVHWSALGGGRYLYPRLFPLSLPKRGVMASQRCVWSPPCDIYSLGAAALEITNAQMWSCRNKNYLLLHPIAAVCFSCSLRMEHFLFCRWNDLHTCLWNGCIQKYICQAHWLVRLVALSACSTWTMAARPLNADWA